MSNLQILLADGNIKERDALASRFRLAGHAILTADSGFHITHLCERQKFDLIILGEKLTDMPGKEALTLLRHHQTPNPTPIIMIAGTEDKNEHDILKEWGANEVVAKTNNFNHFVTAIKNIKKLQGANA